MLPLEKICSPFSLLYLSWLKIDLMAWWTHLICFCRHSLVAFNTILTWFKAPWLYQRETSIGPKADEGCDEFIVATSLENVFCLQGNHSPRRNRESIYPGVIEHKANSLAAKTCKDSSMRAFQIQICLRGIFKFPF